MRKRWTVNVALHTKRLSDPHTWTGRVSGHSPAVASCRAVKLALDANRDTLRGRQLARVAVHLDNLGHVDETGTLKPDGGTP